MPASMDSSSPKSPRSESEAEPDYKYKDRISCLPEQVIDRILSLLTSREAQATCVLSRRWRHLYNSLLTDLDFDWLDLLEKLRDDPEQAEKERARYVEWVDNVVHHQSGKEHSLRRFVLRFDLNNSYKSHVDHWIRFALAKQVKVLDLHFMPVCYDDFKPDCDPSRLPYVLEREILMDADVGCSRRASGLGNFGLSPSISWHVGCRNLEQLSLFRVNVEGELIEQLLAACPVLEKLVLEYARGLRWLRVSGESQKLKYLCIRVCKDLQLIEIYDTTNLVSFTYRGWSFTYRGFEEQIIWYLDNVPRLSEVSIEGFSARQVDLIMSGLSRYSSLQIMKLYFTMPFPERVRLHRRQLPKFTSVKQLELRFEGYGDSSLLPLTPLIEAFPCLRSFVVELIYPKDMLCSPRELKRVVGPPHQFLKVVEFNNYYGRPCDLELVNYFIDNAIALEKLVVNPCEEEYITDGVKKVKEPRERALQQLMGKLPSRIELVIN